MPDWTRAKNNAAANKFAKAIKAELYRKGQSVGGWDDKEKCKAELLSELLHRAVEKGDPLETGVLAMMLYDRGDAIVPRNKEGQNEKED